MQINRGEIWSQFPFTRQKNLFGAIRHLQYTYYKKPKNSFLLSHSYKKDLLIFINFTHAKAHLLSAILTQFFD